MSAPVSFVIKPPGAASASAPARPSPLGRHSSSFRGPPSRRLFQQAAEEEDDDEDDAPRTKTDTRKESAFSGFGNGVQKVEKKDEPLVIAALPNKDWRQSSQARNRPSYVPESKPQVVSDPSLDRINDGPQRRGLRQITPPKEEMQVKLEPGEPIMVAQMSIEGEDVKPKVEEELSLDQRALNALLSGSPPPQETDEERAQRELVIQMGQDRDFKDGKVGGNLETDAFRQDLANRPDESTLDDYEKVPISAFGSALLRGMGYDPSKDTAIHIPKARPALLGIGATALHTAPPPEGSASGKNKGKPARPPKVDYAKRGGRGYMPVIQREKSSTPLSITGGSGDVSRRTSPGTMIGTESDASGRRRRRDLDDVDGTDGSERDRGSSRRREDRDGESDRDRERRRDERSRRDDRDKNRRGEREGSRRDDRDRDRARSSRDDRDSRKDDNRRRDDRDDRDRRDRKRDDDGDRYRERERDRDRERR